MKIKTHLKVGALDWQSALSQAQAAVGSAVEAVTQNPAVQQAAQSVGQTAKQLWYWPFAAPQ